MIRLARHDVRVHVRRKVVHIPVRQTTLRPVAAVATEQGKDAHRFPLSCQGHHFSCRRFYHKFSLLCRLPALFPKSWKIPLRSMPRRVNPPNLPLRGSKLPRSPSRCLRSVNRRFARKARHEVRAHVRRKVVHTPARQTTLRPVAAVATEQGNSDVGICKP